MVGTLFFRGHMSVRNHFVRLFDKNKLTLLLAIAVLGSWLVGCTHASPQPAPNPATTSTSQQPPTLDDFWDGRAHFTIEVLDTGLPMGESDTVILPDGTWRSYVHASDQSLGVRDQCGDPVEFPGCLVIFNSADQGKSFHPMRDEVGAPICQIECVRCPCDSRRDHVDQQQYPRVVSLTTENKGTTRALDQWLLVYEYRANTILRRSSDGLAWSSPTEVPLTGIWQDWLMPCRPEATIGDHPYTPTQYDCLVGSPPGIYADANANPPQLYIFVGQGQNPSGMGCYRGPLNGPTSLLRACEHNPLFVGALEYGPQDGRVDANAFFDFRTISSAEIIPVGDRYYLFYEGVRGPGPGDQGDTQFLLGLARSTTPALDGPWELFPGNPLFINLPGNVGLGHADVVVASADTYLYTTLDGNQRSQLRLRWK